jgi:hypothetical protein
VFKAGTISEVWKSDHIKRVKRHCPKTTRKDSCHPQEPGKEEVRAEIMRGPVSPATAPHVLPMVFMIEEKLGETSR